MLPVLHRPEVVDIGVNTVAPLASLRIVHLDNISLIV